MSVNFEMSFCSYRFDQNSNVIIVKISALSCRTRNQDLRSWYSRCLFQATVWPEPIWIKVKKAWLLLPQNQSTYPRGLEFISIEIPPFIPHFIKLPKTVFCEVNPVLQCSHLEVILLSKFGFERGDFNWYRFWASWICTLMLG